MAAAMEAGAAQVTKELLPKRDQCVYTKCYCEENVWKLCDYVKKHTPEELENSYSIFISNYKKVVPIWAQRASKMPDQPVMWDYHVIFLHKSTNECQIYDIDTRLPFPCSFQHYMEEAFGLEDFIHKDYHRFFRVIPASLYLETFASDRSHMKKDTGTWLAEPPPYPCIQTAESTNNIDEYISMKTNTQKGEVMDLSAFVLRFGGTMDLLQSLLKIS